MSASGPSEAAVAAPLAGPGPRRRRPWWRRRWFILAVQVAILLAVLVFWEWGARTRYDDEHFIVDPFLWSRPLRIWTRILEWMGDGTILKNVFITLYEAAMGFLLGVVGGIIAGFLLGRSDFWARVLNPYIQVVNALPRLVFTPIFFILFGLVGGQPRHDRCLRRPDRSARRRRHRVVTQAERRLVKWKPQPAGDLLAA